MNSEHFFYRHFRLVYFSGLLLGLLLAVLYASNQILTGDQTQMLDKGYLGAYQGVWQVFGNAASAVGNVPGSLSALIIGGPLVIWDSPWAPVALLLALRLASFFLFDSIIKAVFSQPVRIAFMVLYWLNPWLLYDSLLYNPSYLCFFTALHFWSAFKMRHQASFTYSALHVLAIGGAMQLHYSWPVLAVMSAYLFYRRMIVISWSGVFAGVAALIASLIPYALEYAKNDTISRESDRYIGYGLVHVYPVLKAILYWLRYSSTLFSNRIITEASFDWVTTVSWLQMVVKYCWQAILFVFGAVTLVVSARLNWHYWKEIKPTVLRGHDIDDDVHWLLLFAAALCLGLSSALCCLLLPFHTGT